MGTSSKIERSGCKAAQRGAFAGMRIVMIVPILVACGPSLHEIAAHNQREVQRADETAARAGETFTPARVSIQRDEVTAVPVARLESGELIHADPSTRALVFVSEACQRREACDSACALAMTYTFHRATDGHVVILRRKVDLRVVGTKRDNSCPAGCGGGAQRAEAPPPTTLEGYRLGTADLAQVELRTVARVEEYVERRCTNTTPVP